MTGTLLHGSMHLSRDGENVHHHLGVSGFATHAVVDRASAVPVDDDIPADIAAVLGCAVLTGGGAVLNAARPRPQDSIMIVGLGGVGMAALITAVSQGVSRIIAVDTLEEKLEHARRLGAHETYTPQQVLEDGVKARYVIECAGNPRAFETAFAATAAGGTTVTAGLPSPGRPRPALAADRHRRGPDNRGQLPRLRRAVPGHPEIRPALAGREAARRGADLVRASPWPTSTRPWTSWPTARPSARSSCSTPASPPAVAAPRVCAVSRCRYSGNAPG